MRSVARCAWWVAWGAALAFAAGAAGCGSCHGGHEKSKSGHGKKPASTTSSNVAQAPAETAGAQRAPSPSAADPLAGLDQVAPGPGTAAGPTTPPARGCAAQGAPSRVWATAGPSAIVAEGDAFVVAGYAPHQPPPGQDLYAVRIAPGAPPTPLGRRDVKPEPSTMIAPPGLARTGAGEVTVAFVDGSGKLHAAVLDAREPSPSTASVHVADGVDTRFAPAVAATGGARLVAYTDGTGTPMRVRLARLAGDHVAAKVDVTPTAMGGAAPVFAAGASPPELVFVDPRAGVSPIVRVPIGADGAPGAGATLRPVGTVYEPPEIAAAQVGDWTAVGYTVVGNAATTAVGVVRAQGDADIAPVPLVPGRGYGLLHVDAAAAPTAAIFAADAPKDTTPHGPREVHVRLVDTQGPGPVLVLRGADGTAHDAAIARRDDGTVAVAWSSTDGEWVTFLHCATE